MTRCCDAIELEGKRTGECINKALLKGPLTGPFLDAKRQWRVVEVRCRGICRNKMESGRVHE